MLVGVFYKWHEIFIITWWINTESYYNYYVILIKYAFIVYIIIFYTLLMAFIINILKSWIDHKVIYIISFRIESLKHKKCFNNSPKNPSETK